MKTTINRDYFIVSRIPRLPNHLKELPWMTEAKKRTVLFCSQAMSGAGTVLENGVIAPGALSKAGKFYSYSQILITHSYPDEVTSNVSNMCVGGFHYEDTYLTMVIPGYRPKFPELKLLIDAPKKGETLFMVNHIVGVVPVEVKEVSNGPIGQFFKKYVKIENDLFSGVPASFVYNLDGEVVGVASISISDMEILAFPSSVLSKYCSHVGILLEKIQSSKFCLPL